MKIIIAAFFFWTVWDRLTAMFSLKQEARHDVAVWERLNSAFMMFLYAGIAIYGFFVMLFLPHVNAVMSFAGMILYMSARVLRNAAIRALGRQWNVYTSAASVTEILKTGPFRYTRHPYYAATLGELLGYALLCNSLYAGVTSVVCFLPLLLGIRIAIEEKKLMERFPKEYRRYQSEVGLFLKK